jgi:hypothetical protein
LWAVIFILVFVLAGVPPAMADEKGESLRRTMAEIALLNTQIADRKADVIAMRQALTQRKEEIKTEILDLCRQKKIKTPSKALNDPRLFYDLKLIAEIRAYIDRYTQKIGYYRVAGDRLSYLYQQADDALKIISTLSGMKIDALTSQAGKVLDDYLPEAQTIIIHPGNLVFDPPQKIWQTIKTSGEPGQG